MWVSCAKDANRRLRQRPRNSTPPPGHRAGRVLLACNATPGTVFARSGQALREGTNRAIERPKLARRGNFRQPGQFPVNPIDRVVKEHRVVAGPVLRVVLRLFGDGDRAFDQEFTMEAVDLCPAARPQRDVVDADRLVGMRQLFAGAGGLDADVAVRVDITRHVIRRLVFHVERRETAVAEPAEQRVVERDRVVVVQHRELDVTHTPPAHRASSLLALQRTRESPRQPGNSHTRRWEAPWPRPTRLSSI